MWKLIIIRDGAVTKESVTVECSVEQIKSICKFMNRVLSWSSTNQYVDYKEVV